jgi:hypothetical protein
MMSQLKEPESKKCDLSNEELLFELTRRGLADGINGAIGALYDNMLMNGLLDGTRPTTQYLVYRLRRESAAICCIQAESKCAEYWQSKIDQMG